MQHILVIADEIDHNPIAIQHAEQLALAYQVPIHVVFFCYARLREWGSNAAAIKEQVLKGLEDKSSEILTKTITKDIKVTHELVWEKHIHNWVNHYVDIHDVSMVVKTGHRSESMTYTPTDWHLLRECGAPVFIAVEEQWRKAKHVMAAIDLETTNKEKEGLNQKILTEAQQIAKVLGVDLHACYTITVPRLLRDLGIVYPDEKEREVKQEIQPKLEAISKEFGIDMANFHITVGEPDKVLLSNAAKHKIGILVLGMMGRRGLEGSVIGNTAEEILGLLKTDILAIKP
ncbi:universal stress protein [Algicola sagamiensis]|uniref:universal stress protein n=1 Tax=Algicola sagamiensis TaxID=163869 RepID=UPI00036B0D91|nr:universal stress protein [Algicola sagamiensis]